jgi:hypothetical protein
LDASKPTYIGTALGHHGGYVYYFEGMMYGFNWGVVSQSFLHYFRADVIDKDNGSGETRD